MCVEDGLHFFPFSYRACETRYLPTYLYWLLQLDVVQYSPPLQQQQQHQQQQAAETPGIASNNNTCAICG